MSPKPRECGKCFECCRVLHVPWLDKPAGVACEHAGTGPKKGCAIYSTRPKECAAFACMWLRDPEHVGGEFRPDRCGVLLDVTQPIEYQGRMLQAIVAHECRPGAASEGDGLRLVSGLARAVVVIVAPPGGGNRLVRGPSHLVEEYRRATMARKLRAEDGTAVAGKEST